MKNLVLTLALSLMVIGCAPAPSSKIAQRVPAVAIAVTQCGGLVTLYVVLDANHLMRASQKQLALFTVGADGKVSESDSGPMPFEQAMELARKARIQTRVETACSQPGVST